MNGLESGRKGFDTNELPYEIETVSFLSLKSSTRILSWNLFSTYPPEPQLFLRNDLTEVRDENLIRFPEY